MTSVYTWSKSLDDKSTAASAGSEAQGWNGYLNNHNPEADYGRSDFNVGQRFVTSLVYDLPVGRGKQFANQVNPVVNAVIGGWETTAIATFQQGFPTSIQCYDYDVRDGSGRTPGYRDWLWHQPLQSSRRSQEAEVDLQQR